MVKMCHVDTAFLFAPAWRWRLLSLGQDTWIYKATTAKYPEFFSRILTMYIDYVQIKLLIDSSAFYSCNARSFHFRTISLSQKRSYNRLQPYERVFFWSGAIRDIRHQWDSTSGVAKHNKQKHREIIRWQCCIYRVAGTGSPGRYLRSIRLQLDLQHNLEDFNTNQLISKHNQAARLSSSYPFAELLAIWLHAYLYILDSRSSTLPAVGEYVAKTNSDEAVYVALLATLSVDEMTTMFD